jgi:hypothetical protein
VIWSPLPLEVSLYVLSPVVVAEAVWLVLTVTMWLVLLFVDAAV